MTAPLLDIRNMRLSVRTDEGAAQILDHVALTLPRGRILGVVGESGCGKSTLVRAMLGILPRGTTIDSGQILFEGEDLLRLSERELERRIRGSRIGFIPQDPYLALNPVFTVGDQLLSVMRWHAPRRPARRRRARMRHHRARLVELLRRVQIPEPEAVLDRYPHQFSGGQRQRLMIAGALACNPRLVIADEPTTALDVTTQLQILKLLKSLVAEFDLSMLFVTHDFGVVAQLCDDITVMYAGQTVESGPTAAVLAQPQHPYTQALLACHPDRAKALLGIPGRVPSPLNPPPGCRYRAALSACDRLLPPARAAFRGDDAGPSRQLPPRRSTAASGMSAETPILEADDVVVLLGGAKRWLRPTVAPVRAVGGVSLDSARRRDARPRRQIRLREIDARAHAARHPARDERRDPPRRQDRQRRSRRSARGELA